MEVKSRFRNVERLVDWDVRISDGPITYFDPELSYEATGYIPITKTRSLEFNPKWFTEAAEFKKETGKYCPWKFGSKPFRDYWTEQGWRCREGFTFNGFTLTGDNYYFLNFYKLPSIDVEIAGEGRNYATPDFYVEQYKYFHYVQLCRFYGFDGCTLKSRGVGWSEINASMSINMYTWRKNSISLITCSALEQVQDSIKKVYDQMDENNSNTEGGMRRLRQVKDQALKRRSSHIEYIDGQRVERGMKSEVYGIVVDKPNKMRGKRVELLIMDEGGCHAKGTRILMADRSVKNVEDIIFGDEVMGDDYTPRKVLMLHRGSDTMYKIKQDDGREMIVNSNHIIYGKKVYNGCLVDFVMKAKDCYSLSKVRGRYMMLSKKHFLVTNFGNKQELHSFFIEKCGTDDYYGFSLDGNQLFLLADKTICHNSWQDSQKAFTQAKELVTLQGKRIGNILLFGTGGDTGPNLEGLANIFNNPSEFGVLGYRHNHTKTGEYCITGFFVPAWSIIRDLMDERGFVDEEEGKAYRQKHDRDPLASNPKQMLIKCAEQCWYPEEALALEGDDRFNTALLTEQKTRIVNFNRRPKEFTPRYGRLEYTFDDGKVDKANVSGIEFVETAKSGPMDGVCIIEPPQRPEDSNQVYTNLYVAGIDGIDFGDDDTSASTTERSKFCIVIKKRMQGLKQPMYVAYYMGRHDNVKDDYMQALRLIQWYNAKAMIEKTRIGFLSFMDGKKLKYRYMMRRPKSTESDKTRASQNNFGAPSSEQAIQHGLALVAQFVEEYCDTIWMTEMIDQLITYSYEKKRKYDMVAAMQMAELADEELSSSTIHATDDDMKARKGDATYIYGYYTDSRGYRRRGKIKVVSKKKEIGTYNPDLENDINGRFDRTYTSNPVYNEMMEEDF